MAAGLVASINNGHTSIVEPGLSDLVANTVGNGMFRATTDPSDAVCEVDTIFLTVSTSSLDDGAIDLRYIQWVSTMIGKALTPVNTCPVIVVKRTVIPSPPST